MLSTKGHDGPMADSTHSGIKGQNLIIKAFYLKICYQKGEMIEKNFKFSHIEI